MSDFKQDLRDLSEALAREQKAVEAEAERVRALPSGHPDIVNHADRVLAHNERVLSFVERMRLLMADASKL